MILNFQACPDVEGTESTGELEKKFSEKKKYIRIEMPQFHNDIKKDSHISTHDDKKCGVIRHSVHVYYSHSYPTI
jgi:hypothetical protein